MRTVKFLCMTLALLLVCSVAQAQFGRRLGKAVENAAKNTAVRKAEQKTEQAVSSAIDKATDPDTYENNEKATTEKTKGWTCPSCKHAGNTGKFCTECGAKQPDASGWTCPSCKHKGNTGKFCTECGAKQPDASTGATTGTAAATATNNATSTGATATTAEVPAATPAEMAYAKSDFVPGDEIIFSDDFANEQMGEFPTQWDAGEGSIEVVQVNGEKVIELLDGGYMMPLMKSKKAYLPDVFT
ncbi:MAG: zinc ribbon domain-containing protein, partial [Tannerella sp.]|nr:zinc ribbon domain-containing protein [Tannerella sp.]